MLSMTARHVPIVVKVHTPWPCGLWRTRKKKTTSRCPFPLGPAPTTPPPLHQSQSCADAASPAIGGGTAHAVGFPSLSFAPQTNCTLRGSGGCHRADLSVGWTAIELLTIVAPGCLLPSRILPSHVSPNIHSVRPSPRSTEPAPSAPVQPSVRSKMAVQAASGVTFVTGCWSSAALERFGQKSERGTKMASDRTSSRPRHRCTLRPIFTAAPPRVGQKGDQVGQVLLRELLIETGRHHRYGARPHLFDLVAGHADGFGRARHENDLAARIIAHQAVVRLARLRHDLGRLKAPHKARARIENGFEQVSLGSNLADVSEVGADVAPLVAELVARRDGDGRAGEDLLPSPHVPLVDQRQHVRDLLPLFLDVDVDQTIELLGPRVHRRRLLLDPQLDRVDPQRPQSGRRLAPGNHIEANR